MIDTSDLLDLRGFSSDGTVTRDLKKRLAGIRSSRKPLYLRKEELEDIMRWRLGRQVGRSKHWWDLNTEHMINTITRAAFQIHHPDLDYDLQLRIKILTVLNGIGLPVASAILGLMFPEKFAVIDFRSWRQLFDSEKRSFSISDYKRYMKRIRQLARSLGWSPQEVDKALWEYDRMKMQ